MSYGLRKKEKEKEVLNMFRSVIRTIRSFSRTEYGLNGRISSPCSIKQAGIYNAGSV